MPGPYSEYESFPGRQHYVMVVPRAFGQIFFEGIQSMDAANNVNETTHGQYGFKSDVLIAKQYTNTSGSVALKDFNNANFVLRAMTGIEPSNSFIFDSSRLEPVDVFVNIYDEGRSRVMRSCWYVDFTPNVTENNTLDEIETLTINYTAVRKINFEGQQIVCQTFDDTKAGDFKFALMWPAIVDPTVQTSIKAASPGVLTTGQLRHDLCPFPYLLRVWVGDKILDDPEAAQVHTVSTSIPETPLQSTVVLKVPVAEDGQVVKVMWLADGTAPIAQKGVTSAAVMVAAEPDIAAGGPPPTWGDHITVYWSKSLSAASLALLTAADFELVYVDSGGASYTLVPVVPPTVTGLSETDNVITLDFTGANSTPAAGPGWSSGDAAVLSYVGTVLQDVEGFTTPPHSLKDLTF